jgi:hypothetical protein
MKKFFLRAVRTSVKTDSKENSSTSKSWGAVLRILSLIILIFSVIYIGYIAFTNVYIPDLIRYIFDSTPQAQPILKPPIINSLILIEKPNKYRMTGFAETGTSIIISGVELEDSYFVENIDGGKLLKIWPQDGVFQTEFKLQPSAPLIINTKLESSGQESDSPIVIAPGNLEEFIANLTPIKAEYKFIISSEGTRREVKATGLTTSPPFSTLLKDKTQLNTFLNVVVGDILVNDVGWIYFEQQLPRINIKDGLATVSAQSGPFRVGEVRLIGVSQLNIQLRDIPLAQIGILDKLQVTVEDHHDVLSVSPSPSSIDEKVYTWTEPQPDEVIELRLSKDLSSQISALPDFPISALAEGNSIVSNVLGFAADLLVAFIMVVLLWINSKIDSTSLAKKSPLRRTKSMLINSGALLMLPSFFYLVNSIAAALFESFYGIIESAKETFRYLFPPIGTLNSFLLMSVITIVILLLLASYITWLVAPRFPYAHQINVMVSRAGFYLVFLVSSEFLTDRIYLLPRETLQYLDYARWFFISVLLSIIGFALINNVMWFINRYEVSKKDARIPRTVFTIIKLLIPVIALSVTYRPTTQDITSNSLNIHDNVRVILQIMNNGIIYYSAFGAIMIAVLLGKEHSWKWESKQEVLETSVLQLRERKWYERERYWILLGTVMFSGYLVGTRNDILSIPVSAILALIVFPYLLATQEKLGQFAFYADRVYANRKQLLNQLADDLALEKLKSKLEHLLVNLSRGKINPSEYDQSAAILQKEVDHLENERNIKDIPANDFALAFGPERKPLDNAFLGAKWAFLLQIPILFLLFNSRVLDRGDYPWIYLMVAEFVFVMRWVIIGFFFGLFYEYINGNNGIRKALTVTLGFLVSIVPYRLIKGVDSLSDIQATIVEIGLFLLLILILGVLFDRETLQKHGFGTSYLAVVASDFTSLAFVFSLLVPVITVIIPTIITGQFGQILTLIVKDILPVLTNVPGQ